MHNYKRLFLLFSVLSFTFLNPINGQSQLVEQLQQSLDVHESKVSQEKVYISFDRNTYVIGDHIWFHVFLMDREGNRPGGISNYVHVEFFELGNGNVLAKRIVKIENGIGQADVKFLPTRDANIGVRGYTHHMLNFDETSQFVGNLNFIKSSKANSSSRAKGLDIQFLPESGHLLDGVPNILAFKGLSKEGRSVHFDGVIRNMTTGEIIPLKTQFAGLGRVTIVPQMESTYRAEINYLGNTYEFNLPRVEQTGFQLNCELYDKRLKILVSSVVGPLNGTSVIIHKDNAIVFSTTISSDEESEFIFDASGLEEGVYQVSLFDNKGNPRAERMVYLNLDTTEALRTNLQVNFENGEAFANLEIDEKFIGSFSVFDAKYDNNPYETSIKDYLLLNSHVKGIIENPGFYFDKTIPKHVRNFALDMLMLTQGWSRFDWDSVSDDTIDNGNIAAETEGLNIRLRTFVDYGKGDKRPLQTEVNLVDRDSLVMTKGKTFTNGEILFFKDFSDTLNLFAKAEAVTFNGRQLRDSESISIVHAPLQSTYTPTIVASERYTPPVIFKESSEKMPFLRAALNQINLKNVTVTAPKKERKRQQLPIEYFKRTGQVYNPSFVTRRKVVTDGERRMFNSPMDLLTQMGITVGLIARHSEEITEFESAFGNETNVSSNQRYPSLSGSGSGRISGTPLFLLDGVPVDASYILDLSLFEIDFVDTLLGPEAAVYGLRGSNGVIAFYTKTGRSPEFKVGQAKNEVVFKVKGYYKSRQFYKPEINRAGKQANGLPVPTFEFQTIESANSIASFSVDEGAEDVVIKIEGITESGKPFVVKQMFSPIANN